MGIDYYAQAIIGLRIYVEDLEQIKEVFAPTCDHKIPEWAKYCPSCGKSCLKGQTMLVTDIDVDKDEELDGFPLFNDWNRECVFVSICETERLDLKRDSAMDGSPVEVDLSRKDELREAMQRRGLWDEGEFGLFVVPYVG